MLVIEVATTVMSCKWENEGERKENMKSKGKFKMPYNTATQRKTLIFFIYSLRWMDGWMDGRQRGMAREERRKESLKEGKKEERKDT